MPLESTRSRTRRPRHAAAAAVLLSALASQVAAAAVATDPWYEHYARAERALEKEDWALAVLELNEAIGKRGDSGARVRTYGMKITSYFPYLKLGIAYYELGQLDAALRAFDTEERLGAVARSERDSAELARYRGLAVAVRDAAAVEEQARIEGIVGRNLDDARQLEGRGLLDEAMIAVDRALAVAPDDAGALAAMDRLRRAFAQREQDRVRSRQAAAAIETGRGRLDEGRYQEAASLFRRALSLEDSAAARALLDEAQRALLAELEADRELEDRRALVAEGLDAARRLESEGEWLAALDRLETVLALEPASPAARSLQARLLEAQRQSEGERARRQEVERLLGQARALLEEGSAEEFLALANRVLALDPGNRVILEDVAGAYRMISRRLLGTAARLNIPPAVSFVDLRQEADDGLLVQTVRRPDFTLRGVVIDDSEVDVVFFDDRGAEMSATVLDRQPLGDFTVTEFTLEGRLLPGLSTLRLVATDAESLSSSGEYALLYARPFYAAPWFQGLVAGSALTAGGVLVWRRRRRRRRLRRRRFNPYVAGAPILDESMFFGRGPLVDRILETVHNNSLLLYGERRIGKTSIQHQLKRRLSQLEDPTYEFYPVYIDLQGTPQARFFSVMAEDIFHELAPFLDGQRPRRDTSSDYSYRDFIRDVHAVLKTLGERSRKKIKLVLLIDEVDELNDYDPRVNQKLRSLFMKSFAENLVAVVSGVEIKKQWDREGSPWYNFFEEIEVEPLSREEARELVQRPIRGIFKLDDAAVDRIVALTQGRPYLIQRLCVSLVSRQHQEGRRRITVQDVEAVGRPGEG